MALALLASSTGAQPGPLPACKDRIAGKGTPDFAVTYRCVRRWAHANLSREEARNQVQRWFDGLPPQAKALAPSDMIDVKTAQILRQAPPSGPDEGSVVTLSQRGKKLLMTRTVAASKQSSVFLYDGRRSMYTVRGADVQIHPGLRYVYLRDYVFPGQGIAGLPLARTAAGQSTPGTQLTTLVAMSDGVPDSSGLPSYRPGSVSTTRVGQDECVSAVVSGEDQGYQQRCQYSDYRRIGPGLVLPGRIHLLERYSPGLILPQRDFCSLEYTLVSASATPRPEAEFTFEGQLRGAAIVQDNSRRKNLAMRYTPGKSIDEQFAEDDKLRTEAQRAIGRSAARKVFTGTVGLLGLVAALAGWIWYRHSVSGRKAA